MTVVICNVCQKDFYVKAFEVRRGNGKFCSRKCRDANITTPLKTRFERCIGHTTESGCIIWIGTIASNGYGRITKDKNRPGPKILQAHRLAWEYAFGPIPEGLDILHKCDNPPCVNPEHLFLGTHEINMDDKVSKGRQAKGEGCNLSKLTEDAVRQIRLKYKRRRVTLQQLADEFGTTFSNIAYIVRGKSWKHVI